jgi:hypothetical protein
MDRLILQNIALGDLQNYHGFWEWVHSQLEHYRRKVDFIEIKIWNCYHKLALQGQETNKFYIQHSM